ncbi:hypothetical protein SAMN05428985_103647 [Nocardioides sp. YR527]|uniref:hypothetical protein n=1 Tax=Nocardioides sp. YR527 TaxID=1881028 RepID=UPI000880D005|nr:hypothetical protein [Nocardioides sp. YR527]SDK33689.1 hypothetical protein SAMN05428985_103647 [Nocardioides sp. YR527]
MRGVGRIVAFFAPNLATFLQERGMSPAELYRLYGVVLLLSGIAVIALHATYRRLNRADAMEAEEEAERAERVAADA